MYKEDRCVYEPLTRRESEVFSLKEQGKSPTEIAAILALARDTVYAHLRMIKAKTECKSSSLDEPAKRYMANNPFYLNLYKKRVYFEANKPKNQSEVSESKELTQFFDELVNNGIYFGGKQGHLKPGSTRPFDTKTDRLITFGHYGQTDSMITILNAGVEILAENGETLKLARPADVTPPDMHRSRF